MRTYETYRGAIRNFFRDRKERGGLTIGDAMELVQRGWRYANARMKTDWAKITAGSLEARRQGAFDAIARFGKTIRVRVLQEEIRLAVLAYWVALPPSRPRSRVIRELSVA